jgi:hypothetical protein
MSAPTRPGTSSRWCTTASSTTLLTDSSDNYQNEIAWNAGGGGISPVENSGYWQNGVVPWSTAGARGLPDIAFDADPNTGADLRQRNTHPDRWHQPVLAAGARLLDAAAIRSPQQPRFRSTEALRHLQRSADDRSAPPTTVPSSYHDILAGINGLYSATPGWDYVTGLGSWDLNNLDQAIK